MQRRPLSVSRVCGACAVSLLLALPPAHAGAQTVLGIPAGVRVRVSIADSLRPGPFAARSQKIIGNLYRETSDSLFLSIGGSDPVGIARARIHDLRVSAGASRGRSAGVQALGLGVLSAAVMYASTARSDDRRGSDVLSAGAIGFGFGAVLGAISPFETWRRVRGR